MNKRNNAIDLLKIIGIVTMVIDHTRYILPHYQLYFIAIGRVAFICFACVMAFNAHQIFKNNKLTSLKNYFFKLIIFGLISEIPYRLATGIHSDTINIMATLTLGLISIWLFNKYQLFIFIFIPICLLINKYIEFGLLGVLLILGFYFLFLYKEKNKKSLFYVSLIIVFLLSCLCNLQYYKLIILAFGISSIWVYSMLLGCILGTILVLLTILKGYPFKVVKIHYFAWWFYPLHLLIIGFIKNIF